MKRFLSLVILVALLLMGCGGEKQVDTLTVCIDGNGLNEMYLGPILAEFEHQNPNIKLEVNYLPPYKADDPAMIERRSAAFTRTRTELMSGKGADIYLFLGAYGSAASADSYMLFPDLERNILSGALHDLGFLFEHEDFRGSDYVGGLTETGMSDGKPYVLPLSYQIFGLVGVDSALTESGFDTEQSDPAEFTRQLLELGEKCPFLGTYCHTMLLNSVAMPPVSAQNAQILLQEPQWQQTFELIRQLQGGTGGEIGDFASFLDYTTAAQNGAALLPGASFSMCAHSLRVLEDAGYPARFLGFPNEHGGVTVQPYVTAVVSAGCRNTDAAAELLLWLLSDTVQGCKELKFVGSHANLSFNGFSWPVRRGSAKDMLEQLKFYPVEPGSISETLQTDITALEERIDTFRIPNRYDTSLYSLVEGYLRGEQSWEDCWLGITDAWNYLDE